MKKLLAISLCAGLLLSMAAASLAAATVGGEYRYDMYDDDTKSPSHYGKHELLYSVAGNLSDSVYAFANFKFSHASTDDDSSWKSEVDEFYATVKQSWGNFKMGYYEYKFTPSREELKSGSMHVFPKTDATFEVNIPIAAGLTVDGVVAPYAQDSQDVKSDDGAYAVAANYSAKNWGAKVTYADLGKGRFDAAEKVYYGGDLTAVDVYYNLTGDMKFFVDAVDYSEYKGNKGDKYQDGFDPVIGFKWSNVASIKDLSASLEYALNPRNEDQADEYNEYVLKAGYKLTNGISLTLYRFVKGDDQFQNKLRFKYVF